MVLRPWMMWLLLGILVVAGCGRRQQPAQAPAPPAGEVAEVRVTASEFKLEALQTEFVAGRRYRFVVTNQGSVNHEFMIMPPMMSGMSMEKMDEMALTMITEDDLRPGTTKTIEVTFPKAAPEGKLEFACHVEGHNEAGMRLPMIVR